MDGGNVKKGVVVLFWLARQSVGCTEMRIANDRQMCGICSRRIGMDGWMAGGAARD